VVAVAATGRTSTGTDRLRPPPATLLDTILSLGMLAVIAGGVLVVYGLMQRREIAEEVASGRYRRGTLVGSIVFVALFTLLAYWRLGLWHPQQTPPETPDVLPGTGAAPGQSPVDPAKNTYEPHIAWIPVGIVAALVAVAVAAYVVSERRRRPPARARDELAADVAAVLDDTLDDLRAEADPRRAVIAAYVRLERVLAAHGVPRRRAETEEEFLERMLRALDVSRAPASRLTALFERARFSSHAVDSGMKDEAIGALEQVRDELAPPDEEPSAVETETAAVS
jgi:hypothetical protein